MNKENKKKLFVKGALRAVLTVGGVAGLSAIFPMALPYFFLGGYGAYYASMKLTANKMKKMENWDPTYEPKIINLRAYNAGEEDPVYDMEKPEENIIEAYEDKIVNEIIGKTEMAVGKVANKLGIKKRKFSMSDDKKLLKEQKKIERDIKTEKIFEQIH